MQITPFIFNSRHASPLRILSPRLHDGTSIDRWIAGDPISTIDQACNDIDDCRRLIDIIWSCLTTIFACTWLTLHPNIPPPVNDQGLNFLHKRILLTKRFLRHQMTPFIVALIAPEWILAWAMQQWTIARQISKEGGIYVPLRYSS
ncbi:hypothetical protein CPB86DRAFT_792002 [Serendipita vermifera]|nr:hypothetical protein CPB86DRAFT_792002 [Serendipita vermifera]